MSKETKYNFEEANNFALFGGVGDWYFQSEQEREKNHKERLALPSSAQNTIDARKRNLARVEARNKRLKDKKARL